MADFGAVIVAAGMSTRMKDFKQLMDAGGIPMAERVVLNFLKAGVRDIVMVTGYRAQEVEKTLSRYGITFLRNEAYDHTEMFDSAKIGLSYAKDICDRVYFCPVDVPFFSEKTIRDLAAKRAKLVIPVSGDKQGHPILLSSSLIPRILAYEGTGGLRGALASCDVKRALLKADDEGILLDADTKEDYHHLMELRNRQLLRPEVKLRIANEKAFFGPGTVSLLKQIDRTGNVREACMRSGISYSKGWSIIRSLESGIGKRIVERRQGGKDGGEAHVSEEGRELIRLYEQLEADVSGFANERFRQVFGDSGLL